MVREKNNNNAPAIMAPKILVAANVIAKNITANKIVPKIPDNKTGRIEQIQPRTSLLLAFDTASITARYATDIPNKTHKNTGVIVMVAVIVRNAVIIPIIILATIARPVQLHLQQQLRLVI